MNQSLVFRVFWKENELQRLIGTSCQWLVLLNVVLIRASNKAVHQLTTNSNISFSLHFQSFNVYGSPYFLSKPIIMLLLWCQSLHWTRMDEDEAEEGGDDEKSLRFRRKNKDQAKMFGTSRDIHFRQRNNNCGQVWFKPINYIIFNFSCMTTILFLSNFGHL